jgi:ABC-type transporter Mla subunit MlaD
MLRALAIDEISFGPAHTSVATDLNNLAGLLEATNRMAEVEPVRRRVLEIFLKFTRATGHRHPHLQGAVDNYAAWLEEIGRSDEEIFATLLQIAQEFS